MKGVLIDINHVRRTCFDSTHGLKEVLQRKIAAHRLALSSVCARCDHLGHDSRRTYLVGVVSYFLLVVSSDR